MKPLTEKKLHILAADPYTLSEGEKRAHEQHWISMAYNDRVIWGKIQGTKPQPYQIQIDRTSHSSSCTCTTYPHPCKHAIGLALLFIREPSVLPYSETEPDWLKTTKVSRKKNMEWAFPVLEIVFALLEIFV